MHATRFHAASLVLIGAIAALAGCTELEPRIPRVADDGAATALPATQPLVLSSSRFAAERADEAMTISSALDRITKRVVPLDHMYRHEGTGHGVTVYVYDGGVSTTHPELAGRVRVGYSAYPTDPPICNAHGTAVAGAIAGATLGVAPEARIVDVKIIQCASLRGPIHGIIDATAWVIRDHREHGGRAVVNWSFLADTEATIPALDSSVALLRAAGMPVIVSAGNADVNACHASPADAPGVIVVGATTITLDTVSGTAFPVDVRTPGTAWGPCIDLFAPGDSDLLPSLDSSGAPSFQHWFGTSMATGYVSGAAALYLEARPDATPDEVGDFLRANATRSVVGDGCASLGRMLYVGPRTVTTADPHTPGAPR
ncbi:MAG TPA: S8 family peptidase, partial [Gemmatimonadaceae bacterium]|nr:S8 family peptidase [Gemmatimonadaceae bacterium]